MLLLVFLQSSLETNDRLVLNHTISRSVVEIYLPHKQTSTNAGLSPGVGEFAMRYLGALSKLI